MNVDAAKMYAHMDVINTCHLVFNDTPYLRKVVEDYACTICHEKDTCKIKGRCKATDKTIHQLNTLTVVVVLHDVGAPEFGILETDRMFSLEQILVSINPILAEYLSEGDNMQVHLAMCLANTKAQSVELHVDNNVNKK